MVVVMAAGACFITSTVRCFFAVAVACSTVFLDLESSVMKTPRRRTGSSLGRIVVMNSLLMEKSEVVGKSGWVRSKFVTMIHLEGLICMLCIVKKDWMR